MKHIKQILIAISVVALLTACSGGDDAATTDATTTAGSGTSTTESTGTTTTPSTAADLYSGIYSGFLEKETLTASYEGPVRLTLARDLTGNYSVTGTLNMTRSVTLGLPTTTSDIISGTVTSAGALSATGNINVVSITGNINSETRIITGTIVYKTGSSSTFTYNFILYDDALTYEA